MTILYGTLIQELQERISRAHASLLAPQALPLRAWLEMQLGAEPGAKDSLLGHPVFEHKFGFREGEKTLHELGQDGLVHPRLVDAMDSPPRAFDDQRFNRAWRPYTHQVEAWRAVGEGQSIVVSAGTGAGKTECFAVPILSDMVTRSLSRRATLEGVQALFLYPLNALINSQRERLSAWTRPFEGAVRYCLYNGETPETAKADKQRMEPERVLSRRALRASPPPLLITNATMLEYMLVRPKDAEILERSQGTLRYIVIDEAHTYVGSMAAELALLLRRVMNAFKVEAKDVRFIATSATLSSGGGAQEDLQRFLADIAGQPMSRVTVITDQREIPRLPPRQELGDLPDLRALESMDEPQRFEQLLGHRGPRVLREALISRNGRTAPALRRALRAEGLDVSTQELVRLLDMGTRAKPPQTTDKPPQAFLPLRGHLFARGLAGLWACSSPSCAGRSGPLQDEAWPYGAVWASRRTSCEHCASRVYELTLCMQCGHEHLLAALKHDGQGDSLAPIDFASLESTVDELDDAESDDDEVEDPDAPELVDEGPVQRVFVNVVAEGCESFDPCSGRLGEGERSVDYQEPGEAQRCHRCGYKGRQERLFARPLRTGRSFLLGVAVPALLQAMPPMEKHSLRKPWEGRRTITFTDSRQGTARFAARTQSEAERSFVRSFIFHELLSDWTSDPAEVEREEAELAQLRDLYEKQGRPALLRSLLQDKEEKVAKLSAPPSATLEHLAGKLSGTHEFQNLHKFRQTYLPFQQSGVDQRTLAYWLVLREFARRPMRSASLETLGLVRVSYDGLDTRRAPPHLWRTLVPDAPEAAWADFLKLCMDFYVRSNTAIVFDRVNEFFRWVGSQITKKVVGGPESTGERNVRVTWPRAGRNSRLEGLVRRALGLMGEDQETADQIDDLFHEAWKRIQPQRELMKAESSRGWALRPESIRLTLIQEAWLCPITRTLLDTTLLGHSPYQPAKGSPASTLCKKVRMPRPPVAWGQRHASRAELRAWFEADPTVRAAREAGAISEFTERIYEFVEYFQSAEHSAQISSGALKVTETQFKAGHLNLLSCSTTMEMGVDIGNLSGIAMNNAPPSPANFLQRVGRAGRRGEAASVSLTVCRQMPHDQGVFEQPDWPFTTPMHITPVKLDSEPIVARHVRAACLTRFLLAFAKDQDIRRLTCGWFLTPDEEGASVCARLRDWLVQPSTVEALAADLARIIRGSSLDGSSSELLLAEAVPVFEALEGRYRVVREALGQELTKLPEDEREESPAAFAILRQIARLEKEYLLSYLADEQVLPGYGFPTGVVPFVHTTLEELRALKTEVDKARRKSGGEDEDPEVKKQRIDARDRLTGLATRDLPMAIREYAPGATLVLDRRSYTSRGVRLSWQLPPSATERNLNSVQSLKLAWRCASCGAAGTTQRSLMMESCPACGGELRRQVELLEPSGFATDLFEDAQLEVTRSAFIPVTPPWISSGEGRFRTLGRPAMVRYRHTSSGEIIYLSKGAHGHGYALCLRCGRAEPEPQEPSELGGHPLPTKMLKHKRLRGGKGSDWKTETAGLSCEGNDEAGWAIRRHLSLGGSLRTDVLELHLKNPATGQWEHDREQMTTIAVALRKVAAEALGVEDSELGFQVSRRSEDGHQYRAILLYDTASGGAGFVAQLPERLPELLASAALACRTCPRDCDRVCHGCLLSSDTQYSVDHIHRHVVAPDGAPRALLGVRFLQALELKPEERVFGGQTTLIWTDPVERLVDHVRLLAREGATAVTFFIDPEADRWDPLAWAGRHTVRRLLAAGEEVTVQLAVPRGSASGLEWQLSRQLAALLESETLVLREVAALPVDGGLARWAEVRAGADTLAWSGLGSVPPSLDGEWPGDGEESLFVVGPARATPLEGQVDAESLAVPPPSPVTAMDLGSLAGSFCTDIGVRTLTLLERERPGFLRTLGERGPARRVEVHDRYLLKPFTLQVLFNLLQALKGRGALGQDTQIHVSTLQAGEDRRGRTPWTVDHDWTVPAEHETVFAEVLNSLGCQVQLHLRTRRDTAQLEHARRVTISWENERMELRFDQGFGFLAPADRHGHGAPRFPFGRGTDEQVRHIFAARWRLIRKAAPGPIPGYLIWSQIR
ncbi:MAG: DEAD/DEAH box helicase [Alphaproteobacteria bacterium]|nr:DEAD/DEAH box helicase [Alphaproteobacteria bacterium]